MNDSTKQASGFKLGTLQRLVFTKDDKNIMTFLHYVEKIVRTAYPEAEEFIDELKDTANVAKISIDQLKTDCNEFMQKIQNCQSSVDIGNLSDPSCFHPKDKVLAYVLADLPEARTKRENLRDQMNVTIDEFTKLMRFYGEDPTDVQSSTTFFAKFVNFINEYKRVRQENLQREVENRAYEARKKLAENKKSDRDDGMTESNIDTSKSNAVMDTLLEKLPTPTSTAANGHVQTSPLSNSKQHHIPQPAHKQPQLQIYGVVLYDFIAERSDELQAKAGESIIIIAKSNNEWFVAKPIGRLGGPGLIPISFIEVRNISTNRPVDNLEEAIQQAEVPRVEEWKRLAAEYKASSIPLGKLEDNTAGKETLSVTEQLQNLNLSGGAYGTKQPSAHYQQETASLQRQHQPHQQQQQQQQQNELQIQQHYQQDDQQFQDYELEPYVVSASVDLHSDNTTVLESINNDGSATDILDIMDGKPVALKGDKYVKIKVFYGDDLIAIKVPNNIAFKSLVDRVADRLGLQHVVLLYKDEATGAVAELRNEHDFLSALGNREKLVLLAQ
ncbi:hypothetical protein D0Z00_002488 [Geotrichum galactomycetum]|uniref:Uncharacterized protein n=1 Tax=Geotrichum galactomycetum TaxID=27317 RepID=A0ACB6V406_9ASCO|nr:hypothetical protein D0Z00_002488 [Geotrichum candidum]